MFISTKSQLRRPEDGYSSRARPRPPRRRALRALPTKPGVGVGGTAAADRLIGVPKPGTEDFHLWTLWLGERLAAAGPAPVEAHLGAMARLGRRRDPVCANLVDDQRRPAVTRGRAFFALAATLDRYDPDSPEPPDAA